VKSGWNNVNNQSDIDTLLNIYGGFHDSCITELRYISGANVDEDLSMGFGKSIDRKLYVIFKRQWAPIKIELLFEGMRQMNIAGWQNNYFCEIFDCYLAIHNDLIKGIDDNLIVWADNYGFNPKELYERNILNEPLTTYIFSEKLKWRILED
jgi:hypothetical protein